MAHFPYPFLLLLQVRVRQSLNSKIYLLTAYRLPKAQISAFVAILFGTFFQRDYLPVKDQFLSIQKYGSKRIQQSNLINRSFNMQAQREKVLVLGANGKVGKHLVKFLIQHYRVVALIQDAPKYGINSPHIEYANGDAFDNGVLNPLLQNVKLVVSCLKPITPHTFQEYIEHLISSIKANNSPKLILIASLGVLKDKEDKPLLNSNQFPNQLKEDAESHLKALEALKKSGIDYTVVCAPAIENGMDDENAEVAVEKADGEVKFSVKGGNLGNLVLEEAKGGSHLGRVIGVWNK